MSAEGKKKRGESGLSNAKTIPFRYGGRPCNYDTKTYRSNHPRGAGSRLVSTVLFGSFLSENYKESLSEVLLRRVENAAGSCTHELLRLA